MKVLMTTLNAKFIHTSLALGYLEASLAPGADYEADYVDEAGEHDVQVVREEYTINTPLSEVLEGIFRHRAQLVAFSCYIWNIQQILTVAANLKQVAPETVIILGGPEVSYEPNQVMTDFPYIDMVVAGEGEVSFPGVVRKFTNLITGEMTLDQSTFQELPGVWWRAVGQIWSAYESGPPLAPIVAIPSPYRGDLSRFAQQIAYLETSRGCPYSCSYCLSSSTQGVRYFPLEQIKEDIRRLLARGVKQIKFIDRTFNANKRRALELWSYLVTNSQELEINYHFEISVQLLDQELLEFLAQVPAGLFQFEIGIQSTNQETLAAINRSADWEKIKANVVKLRQGNNIHLHLDLIAGLPYEHYSSFVNSFNQVLNLQPHYLQVGFLKLLKGTTIRETALEHGYRYTDEPPYQVLTNNYITFPELLEVAQVEELVDKLYNSHQYYYSMNCLLASFGDKKYQLFTLIEEYLNQRNLSGKSIRQRDWYHHLLSWAAQLERGRGQDQELIMELVTIDLLRQQRLTQLPEWAVNKQVKYSKLAKQVTMLPISQATGEELIRQGLTFKKQDDIQEIAVIFDYGVAPDPIIGGAALYLVKR